MIRHTGIDVFTSALNRIEQLYREGHRVVVSFSGGKDSGVCLELAIMAAANAGRLPVEVAMRDEEIMLPGTFEYCERLLDRPEIDFHWFVANQPVINVFNRKNPYWWVFDPELDPSAWVRDPHPTTEFIEDKNIHLMTSTKRFPPPEGKKLIVILGLRTSESPNRKMGIHSSKSFLTKHPGQGGAYYARPIYDWRDGDVWKAHKDFQWDYNKAYDVMFRMGVKKNDLRIAPPTLVTGGIRVLGTMRKAFPRWFEQVCERLPGVRSAALFGDRALKPSRRLGESWEECFQRTCIDEAPEWIAERAARIRDTQVGRHGRHSTSPFPEVAPCMLCGSPMLASWKGLTKICYMGDPFCLKQQAVPYVEPEYFRPGAGTWGGKPTW